MKKSYRQRNIPQEKFEKLSLGQQTLLKYRVSLGMTQGDFADFMGISKSYVAQIETGKGEPSPLLLELIESKSKNVSLNETQTPRSLLRAAREAKGMSQKDLAKATGYGIGYIQALEEAGARLSEKFAAKVAAALDLEIDDLLRGSDHPPTVGTGAGTVGSTPNVITTDGIKARNIPLISMAQAGELIDHTDAIYDYESITAYDVRDSKAIAIRIKGDSMSPEFPEGSIAVVCPSYEAQTGDYVIARLTAGGVVFKKLERIGHTYRFISSNPAYEMFTAEAEEIAWCYPVDQVIRKMR